MSKKAKEEMLKVEIETRDDDKAFKRHKSYVMGLYKHQAKKQAKNGGNE